ncbi:MAG TPA: hypothetical protein VHN37_14720 [Actinomycetota bacterium]|nr:hypothetical protein [Actinomycetota bacterium]
MSKETKVRELFVDELAEVRGGAKGGVPGKPDTVTTMACCEEGPFGCCGETVETTTV